MTPYRQCNLPEEPVGEDAPPSFPYVDGPSTTQARLKRDSELEFRCLGIHARAKGTLAIVAVVVLVGMLFAFRMLYNS